MKLPRVLRRLLRGGVDLGHGPLLDSDEVAHWLAQGANLDVLAGAPASAFVAGDRSTKRAGSGMDFDDSRLYEHGDDARHINWRLTARAGSPYVKVFQEERRPCAFVLLDRRAAMRFATTGRLKAHRAAAAAITFAAAAAHRGAPVGGLVLDPDPHWLEPRHGELGVSRLAGAAAAPAPPLDVHHEPALADVLEQLVARLRPGCDLLLLSDFIDLTETSVPTLLRLTREHRVSALQILDPAEIILPDAGPLEVAAATGGGSMSLDSHRADLRRTFEGLARQQMQTQADWFASARISLQTRTTAEPFRPNDLVPAP